MGTEDNNMNITHAERVARNRTELADRLSKIDAATPWLARVLKGADWSQARIYETIQFKEDSYEREVVTSTCIFCGTLQTRSRVLRLLMRSDGVLLVKPDYEEALASPVAVFYEHISRGGDWESYRDELDRLVKCLNIIKSAGDYA